VYTISGFLLGKIHFESI